MKPMVLQLWYVILIPWAAASASAGTEVAAITSIERRGCKEKCGSVDVPYPFGIDNSNCSKNDSFLLTCEYKASSDSSPRLMRDNIQVTNISVEDGTAIVNIFMAYNCYKSIDKIEYYDHKVDLNGTPFMFSATGNKFTAIGCNTLAFIVDSEGTRFESGCFTCCFHAVNPTKEGSCTGVGCCRTEIPTGLKTLNMSIKTVNDSLIPCSYAFLAEQNWSGFSSIDLNDTTNVSRVSPVVLDWALGDENCESLDKSSSTYACGPNSDCRNSGNGPGYRCICKPGYYGNPYLNLSQGCQDINECKDPGKYHCEGKCKNTQGNYTCDCPLGMYGDGKVACRGFSISTIAGVVAVGMIVAVILFFLWRELRRRKKMKIFQKNGGFLLKHQKVRILSETELKRATNNYDADGRVGEGGSATVYKGVLEDGSIVAIKKPKETERSQTQHHLQEVINEQFQHEIDILFQVNHINAVKLLGLCLETKVPLLVYEFVSNGSLYDHIHVKRSTILRSWVNRLRIAADSALALDYLHSLANPPIIHRDVKSMNILLDENLTAKVADFGTSLLIPLNQSIHSKIKGTYGYIDPEYLTTGILTVKSDVYSFGVVLMELLTGQKPLSDQRDGEKANFIQYFISSVKQKKLSQVLTFGEDDPGELEQIEAVAELARRCLSRSGSKRPTMKEVAEQLLGLKKLHKNFRANEREEERESMVGGERVVHHASEENDTMFYTYSKTCYMTTLDN